VPRDDIKTISGQAPVALAERLADAAQIEQRSASQLVVSAVDLYTRLPAEVHIALRRIAATEGEAAVDQLMVDIGRRIVDRQFDAARDRVASKMQLGSAGELETDAQLFAAARKALSHTRPRAKRQTSK